LRARVYTTHILLPLLLSLVSPPRCLCSEAEQEGETFSVYKHLNSCVRTVPWFSSGSFMENYIWFPAPLCPPIKTGKTMSITASKSQPLVVFAYFFGLFLTKNFNFCLCLKIRLLGSTPPSALHK